jgi:hypothetical protein
MVNDLLAWFVATVKADLPAFGGRIFPDVAPEGTANPCLVYQLADDTAEAGLDAGALGHGTLGYQVRIYGASRSSANELRESFRQRFQGIEPVTIGGGWRVEGSAFGELAETYEKETKDYGALAVVEFHVARG